MKKHDLIKQRYKLLFILKIISSLFWPFFVHYNIIRINYLSYNNVKNATAMSRHRIELTVRIL